MIQETYLQNRNQLTKKRKQTYIYQKGYMESEEEKLGVWDEYIHTSTNKIDKQIPTIIVWRIMFIIL